MTQKTILKVDPFYIFSYLCMELHLAKDAANPKVEDADKCIVSNFISVALFRDMQLQLCGKNINSCFQNYMHEW